MKAKQKKKKQKPMTKKQILIYIIITICLGTFAYFLGSMIATQVMKSKNPVENSTADFSDLSQIDSLEPLDLNTFLENFNKISNNNYQINKDDLEEDKISINSIDFSFINEEDKISIVAINYSENNDNIENIITALIRANNQDIDEESAKLLFNKTKETLSEKDGISQYFQYKGVETSMKKIDNNYQFRVGRITK